MRAWAERVAALICLVPCVYLLIRAPTPVLAAWRLEVLKREAREAPPPALTDIGSADLLVRGEVLVRAQSDPLDFTPRPAPGVAWIAPLRAPEDAAGAPVGWILHESAPLHPGTLVETAVSDGPVGFIVILGGLRRDPALFGDALAAVGAPDDALVIRPFLAPREQELAPGWRWLREIALRALMPFLAAAFCVWTLVRKQKR